LENGFLNPVTEKLLPATESYRHLLLRSFDFQCSMCITAKEWWIIRRLKPLLHKQRMVDNPAVETAATQTKPASAGYEYSNN
jgi:hypothetical protein